MNCVSLSRSGLAIILFLLVVLPVHQGYFFFQLAFPVNLVVFSPPEMPSHRCMDLILYFLYISWSSYMIWLTKHCFSIFSSDKHVIVSKSESIGSSSLQIFLSRSPFSFVYLYRKKRIHQNRKEIKNQKNIYMGFHSLFLEPWGFIYFPLKLWCPLAFSRLLVG